MLSAEIFTQIAKHQLQQLLMTVYVFFCLFFFSEKISPYISCECIVCWAGNSYKIPSFISLKKKKKNKR